MNAAAERLTGFSLEEILARDQPLHDIIHHRRPDGRPFPIDECPIDRALPQRAREQGEDVFVHKGGHFYAVAFTASPILEGGVPVGTVIEVRDLGAERHQADALRESEARYRFLAETIPVQIWTALPDGRRGRDRALVRDEHEHRRAARAAASHGRVARRGGGAGASE